MPNLKINSYNPEMQQQLNAALELLKNILESDLLGVYLYGSSVVGGLQKYSDIDLFVVINRETTFNEKKLLISSLLKISGLYMKDSKPPLEVTIVEKSMVNPWHYPPCFDFQYGEWLRDFFEQGIVEPWASKEMPDLALIITQILLKNDVLFGPKAKEILPSIPYKDFMEAMLEGLGDLCRELETDTRNVLLTLARIWSTISTDQIRSKSAAANWAIKRLPKQFWPVVTRAKSICIGMENEHWDDLKTLIKPCSDFILEQINSQKALINFNDSSKSIKMANYSNEN